MTVSPYFVVFEIINFALLALCLWHASKRGWLAVMQLIAGVIFGVMLELATIRQLDAYEYGTFTLMVRDVPLTIGIGWGLVIYSAMLFSDATSLPVWARPILDGLLALNIDLAMDTIAIRLGMWDWGQGLQAQFFGVPYANFWAWFWVVFFFSGGVRLLARWLKALAPIAAIVIGVIGVLATNALITFVVPRSVYVPTVGLTLGAALGIILALRPHLRERALELPAIIVPLTVHLYFLIAGLISGVIFQPPTLLAVSGAMLAISLALHGGSLVRLFRKPLPTTISAAE